MLRPRSSGPLPPSRSLAATEAGLGSVLGNCATWGAGPAVSVAISRLEPTGEVTCNLQAVVRGRDDHLEARVAATNPLQAFFDAHGPGAGVTSGRLDPEIALASLEAFPTLRAPPA